MSTRLDLVLSPGELEGLARRASGVCAVFDVLRATSCMITALAHGARAIVPVCEIAEALALRERQPDVLLAGERRGLRIRAEQSGGVDFDLGNSPREFTAEVVGGRTLAMTTTNGTRALRACGGAATVLVGSFLNLEATARWIERHAPPYLTVVCSGTGDEPALEDVLAAGALCERLWARYGAGHVADSAELARQLHGLLGADLFGAMRHARNGRRLPAIPELRDDVWDCVQRDTVDFAAALTPGGAVCRLE